jgi:hypothetical protein
MGSIAVDAGEDRLGGYGGYVGPGGDVGLEGFGDVGAEAGLGGDATGGLWPDSTDPAGGPGIRHRRQRVPRTRTHLNSGSESSISEYDTDVEDDAEDANVDINGIIYLYCNETWSKNHFTYDPPHMPFFGRNRTSRNFHRAPTILALWELFWPFNLLRKIVEETNCYATKV